MKPKVYNISQNTSPKKSQTNQQQVSNTENQGPPFFVATSGLLAILVIVLIIYDRVQVKKLQKKLKFEKFRSREFEKKLKLSLQTIRKMETNPDLINSRDFNLDYLRMRMAEEVFNFAVLNQVKIKIKDKITVALRPNPDQQVVVGIANNSGRKIDEIFDVEYDTGVSANGKRVLFRIQICLTKLPTQSTSNTINQLINCIEKYLGPAEDHDTWQPTIQGRIAYMHWDQKAKPTPLLVLEQVDEGVNVSFRTSRAAKGKV
ncbi:MAG: hypothetical protein AAF208_05035 [Cyanobacteria bacterium P01_A01_bin.45]